MKNKTKFLILILLVSIVLVAGCLGKKGDGNTPTPIPTPTPEPVENNKAEWGFFLISNVGNPVQDLDTVKWSRLTAVLWSKIQFPDGTYNWTLLDNQTKKAQAEGINLVFELKTGASPLVSETKCYQDTKAEADKQKGELFDLEFYAHSCPVKPEYIDEWKKFVRDVVERYDGDGKNDMPGLSKDFVMDLQIENEAPNPFYWHWGEMDGKKAAESYLSVLIPAVEARDQANPNTKVVIPGMIEPAFLERCSKNPQYSGYCTTPHLKRVTAFTEELLKHPQYFDAIDVHFFNYFKFDPQYINDGMKYFKNKMTENGYQKPIYVYEWTGSIMMMVNSEGHKEEFAQYFPYSAELGTPEAFGEVYKNLNKPENRKYQAWFEAEQAREFPKLFTTMLANGAEKLIYVRFSDFVGSNWDSLWWNWQGIMRYGGSIENPVVIKKPSFYTFQIIEQKIYGFNEVTTLNLGENVFAYKFTFNERKPLVVAWTEGSPTTINLGSGSSKITHIVTELDDNNNPIRPPVTNAPASAVPLTDTPVFIE